MCDIYYAFIFKLICILLLCSLVGVPLFAHARLVSPCASNLDANLLRLRAHFVSGVVWLQIKTNPV